MEREMYGVFRLYDNSLTIATYGLLIIGTIWITANNSIFNLIIGIVFLLLGLVTSFQDYTRKMGIINQMQRELNQKMYQLIKEEAWEEMKKKTKRNTTKQRK